MALFLGLSCAVPGVKNYDPCASLTAQDNLWFCESYECQWRDFILTIPVQKKKEKKKFSPNLIYLKVVLKLQFATFIEDNEIQRRKKQESGAMYISQ